MCLHLASLAIQCLCVGFLSYTQAHIGNVQPFFLDSPLSRITLLGMETSTNARPYITVRLAKLRCLAGMTRNPVLVFDTRRPSDGNYDPGQDFDVRASPEDLLDTWGPGRLVFAEGSPRTPVAVEIGGGYIFPPVSHDTDQRYHWDYCMTLPAAPPHLDLSHTPPPFFRLR